MIYYSFLLVFFLPFALLEEQKPLSVDELQLYLAGVFATRPESRRCPAPLPLDNKRQGVGKDSCRAAPCQGHTSCGPGKACCFNGCLFTCMDASEPPPVIDWEVEPSLEEAGFLNASAAEMYSVPMCTATFQQAPSLPMICPEGFTCRIQEPGDPLTGAPSKGICVPTPTPKTTGMRRAQLQTEKKVDDEKPAYREKIGIESVFLPGGCILSKEQYNNIQEFLHRSYVVNCTCIESSVECQLLKEGSMTEKPQFSTKI